VRKAAPRPRGRPPSPETPSRTWNLKNVVGSLKPEWVFLALALLFGGALLVLTPPFESPDEEAHLRRAFELSEGRVIAVKQGDFTGDYLPRSLQTLFERFKKLRGHHEQRTSAREILDAAAIHVQPDDRAFVPFANTAIHSPLTYLPQTVAVLLARQLSSSVLAYLYAGRLFNLLATTAVMFLAIRRTPIAAWGFAALALTPMAQALAASLSPDALTNALSFVLIAHILSCAIGPEQSVSGRSLALMAIGSAAVGLAKQAYFLLPLLYFMIPVAKMRSWRRYVTGAAIVLGATFAALGSWAFVVRAIYSPADLSFGMNPEQQIALMRADPLEFLRTIARTAVYTPEYAQEYIGWLGLIDLRLPVPLYIAEIALLVGVFLASYDPAAQLTTRQALIAAGVTVLVTLTLVVIIHITWDAVGSESIFLRGRYFIPLGPLVGIVLYRIGALLRPVVRAVTPAVPVVVTLSVPLLLATTVLTVLARYFADSPRAASIRLSMEGETLMQTPGQQAGARVLFERALQLDPDNPLAHSCLGALLIRIRPTEAVEHLRAVLRQNPDDVPTLNNLGLTLASQGQFDEAMRIFRKAQALSPDEESIKKNIEEALKAQEAVADTPRRISLALEERVRSGLLEERYHGTPGAGLYLKRNRGRVVNASGEPLFQRAEMFWRCPPPSDEEIRLFDATGAVLEDRRRIPFYACAADHAGPSRIFVFPAPVGTQALNDEDVSWFYQVPLAELTPEEREREQDYRRRRGLRFPLATLPD
jgi:uncharacterized membrane protein